MDDIDLEYARHSKARNGYCKFTQNGLSNGVECDTYSKCSTCGWNPYVAQKRIIAIREHRRRQQLMGQPEIPEKWLLGKGGYPVKDVVECRYKK